MKPNVILYRKIPDDLLKQLSEETNVTFFDGINAANYDAFIAALANADGVIGTGQKFNADILKYAPKLRVASTISVGYDDFNVTALNQHHVALFHTPGVLTETTADTIFSLMLCVARRIPELAERVKNGEWTKSIGPEWYGSNVHGKTLAITGMGRIGAAIAKRAHLGFGMDILYFNRSSKPEIETLCHAKKVSFEEAISRADFICNVLPATEETKHIFNLATFEKMQPHAFFINGGRGAAVNEADLVTALSRQLIAGAGLDVYEKEPLDANSPLLRMQNVVALPHIGSATHETRKLMSKVAVENLLAGLKGNFEKNCVNRE